MKVDKKDLNIVSVCVEDVRFPTSLGGHGSDALVVYVYKTNIYLQIKYITHFYSTRIRTILVLT